MGAGQAVHTPSHEDLERGNVTTESDLAGGPAKPGMHDLPDVASLVEIQPVATVSRTVLKAEGARVVLFSFDAGQVLTEHTAAVPALLASFPLLIGASRHEPPA
jgi:quercetin dioxygenase-like cupin family protein